MGLAIAQKLNKENFRIYTLLGDGELSEGSVWEACSTANKYKLDNLVVIVDRNKLQITGKTEDVNPIEPLNEKFLSFGFRVKEIDGNNIEELIGAFEEIPFKANKPNVIIANTVKGSGVSFIENQINWHHKVPSKEEFEKANLELENQLKNYE